MKPEIEAKFYPVDKNKIREVLKTNRAKLITPERLMRRVIFDRRRNSQIIPDYIRVRDEGNKVRLSAKVHALSYGELSSQKETDVIVSDFEDTVEILKLSGLVQTGYQETLRETWEFNNAEIVIDSWPGLQTYIEIEATSEENLKTTANLLGMKWEDRRITSVVEIYAEIYKVSNEEVHKQIENVSFEKLPFKQ